METKNKTLIIWSGILLSNLLGFAFILFSKWITEKTSAMEGIFIFSDFVLVPIGMGIICYKFWKKINTKLNDLWWPLIETTVIAIGCSWFIMKEGVICL